MKREYVSDDGQFRHEDLAAVRRYDAERKLDQYETPLVAWLEANGVEDALHLTRAIREKPQEVIELVKPFGGKRRAERKVRSDAGQKRGPRKGRTEVA